MRRNLTTILVQTKCRWRLIQNNTTKRSAHTEAESMASLLEQKLNEELPQTNNNGAASIYRVPHRLRSVEPKAYEPNIVSIGPYHHGALHLQPMENTKWIFFHRLFDPTKPDRPNLRAIVAELKQMEHKARSCYLEDFKLNSKQFIDMLLIDSCFVIQLLKETREVDYSNKSILIKRWMLPVLQRDLVMLENQLPFFVLNKLYDLTGKATDLSLKDLALQFFEPMIYKDLDTPKKNSGLGEKDGGNHLLELIRFSICPTQVLGKEMCGKEPHMFRSITELKESGIKLKKAEKCQPLDVSFEIKKGVLKIAPLSMDDYKFTLFRNMVAFEQCHFACKPHVTAFIFFLDRLINSAKDIELLHYAGIMQHSLGGNKHAARLVNILCKEVAGAVDDSYLHNVLWKINCYCNSGWHQKKAKLKHEYFYNIWVSLSTIAAILLVYLTILQTIWGLGDEDARDHMFGNGFWSSFGEAFLIPFRGVMPSKGRGDVCSNRPLVLGSIPGPLAIVLPLSESGMPLILGIDSLYGPVCVSGKYTFLLLQSKNPSVQIQIDGEQAMDKNKIEEYLQWFFHSNISDEIKPFFFMSC